MENSKKSAEVSDPEKQGLLEQLQLVLRSEHQGLMAALLLFALLAASAYFIIQWNVNHGLVDIDDVARAEFSFQVDLNAATLGELSLLPGVGSKLGQAILVRRGELGRFNHHADLLGVPGIGEKKLEAIRPYLSPLNEP